MMVVLSWRTDTSQNNNPMSASVITRLTQGQIGPFGRFEKRRSEDAGATHANPPLGPPPLKIKK